MSCETMKFSFQHRAFYCYLIMSLWILFLVTGMYKYMGAAEEGGSVRKTAHATPRADARLRRIVSAHCRPADEITRGAEGIPGEEGWQLQGVIAVTRHGDRGPLTHLRRGDTLPCNTVPHSKLLQSYSEFVWNATAGGRAVWVQAPGPFHNFPTLPVRSAATSCALGQLTLHGVHQMLNTGAIMKEAYAERLGWTDNAESDSKQGTAGVDVVAYSTRYRRTFQSALALLFALLPRGAFAARAAALRESHSVTFCFRDCACPHADRFAQRLSSEAKSRLESHPAIVELVQKMSKVVMESPERAEPDVLRDALLASLCHDAPLPCTDAAPTEPASARAAERSPRGLLDADYDDGRRARDAARPPRDFDAQMEKEKLSYYRQRYMESADAGYEDVVVVRKHLDSDFNFHVERQPLQPEDDYAEVTAQAGTERTCVRREQVSSLFAFAEWSRAQAVRSASHRKKGALDAYGFIRHMVQYMIRMVSEGRPKLVYYSGHDRTLRALMAALGLADARRRDAHYASRMLLEVYRHSGRGGGGGDGERSARDYYVRAVLDGADVTERLGCCRGWHNVAVGPARLCPIENIVRFIHDDYFAMFNATNYKDACAPR